MIWNPRNKTLAHWHYFIDTHYGWDGKPVRVGKAKHSEQRLSKRERQERARVQRRKMRKHRRR